MFILTRVFSTASFDIYKSEIIYNITTTLSVPFIAFISLYNFENSHLSKQEWLGILLSIIGVIGLYI